MSEENKKINNKNISQKKNELLDDLDDLLVDEEAHQKDPKVETEQALKKLDSLIKEDLSYNHILGSIKKQKKSHSNKNKYKESVVKKKTHKKDIDTNSKKPIQIKASKFSHVSKIENHEVRRSAHVLDLTQVKKTADKKKINFGLNFKKKNTPENIEEKQVLGYRFPSKEKLSLKERYYDLIDSLRFPSLQLKYASTKIAVFALVLLVVLLPIRGLVFFEQIKNDKNNIINFGKKGFVNLQTGVISASENSYDVAQEDFDQALSNFNSAEEVLNGYNEWLLDSSSFVPVIGKSLSVSRSLLKVAANISEAAAMLNTQIQKEENPTQYLYVINKQIVNTKPHLEQAAKDLESIDPDLLPENMRGYFLGLKQYLPALSEDLDHLNQIFSFLLDYLGDNEEKRYLVLFQNNNELRPTGGFIGSFAIFDVYQGKVVNLEIPKGGMYDLEGAQKYKLKAPKALSLINPHFNIWDANWWPDFPKSSQKIVDLYTKNDGSSVDGVIAINAYVLQELLEVLGPIEMPEYGVTITADNIFSVLQEEVELNYDQELNQPKAIIADLVPQVLDKLLTLGDYQRDVVKVMARMLSTKDIQLYSTDPDIQKRIVDFSWAGQIEDNDKDFLYVVNTNIAGGKTDNDIVQTIDHQAVVQENGDIINNVRITRTNVGEANPFAGLEGGNVSYIRLFVPKGSELIESLGFDELPESYFRTSAGEAKEDPDIAMEENKRLENGSNTEIFTSLDKTVFANWVALKPGESQTVYFKYKLPFKLDVSEKLVNNWWEDILDYNIRLDNYSLLVQSQAGDHNSTFNSSVLLPDNVKVVWNNATDKSKMGITDDLISYNNDLDRDQYFGFIISAK